MKLFLIYALVWAIGIIQTGIMISRDNIGSPETWNPLLLFFLSGFYIFYFFFEHIAQPFLLFGIAGIKIKKLYKILIILNPFLLPIILIIIFFIIETFDINFAPENIVKTALVFLISLVSIISIILQSSALKNIIQNKKQESGLIIFVVLTLGYKLLTCFFSTESIPGRIALGKNFYNLSTYIFTITIYLELFIFNILKLSKEFTGQSREMSISTIKEFGLTKRETDISNLLLKGLTSREIGEKLFITKKTVDTHIYNIYKKCKVKNKIGFFNLTG